MMSLQMVQSVSVHFSFLHMSPCPPPPTPNERGGRMRICPCLSGHGGIFAISLGTHVLRNPGKGGFIIIANVNQVSDIAGISKLHR